MAKKLHPSLESGEFTLDDITFPVFKIPNFEWSEVNLATRLTERITLKTPIISSPMDTVTEHKMARLMAIEGGIGVIHYNMSVEEQMAEVEKVRRYEAGFVLKPEVLGPEATVGDVYERAQRSKELYGHEIFSYPITKDGTLQSELIGLVTHRDVRFTEDMTMRVVEIMTPRDMLIVARREKTLDKGDIRTANDLIRTNNKDTLPIVDKNNRLVALVTDSDLRKNDLAPLATKDKNKQLKVLVAVESRLNLAKERILAAATYGACGIVVDARNIFQEHLEIAKFTKKNAPDLDVILGNVVTGEVVSQLLKEAGKYIDAIRVGIGSGEVCITTESLGIGRPIGSSLRDISKVVLAYRKRTGRHIGIIADGGLKSPAHIIGAGMLSADAFMFGSLLAGVDESPKEEDWDQDRGMLIKKVRGMGSAEVIQERAGGNRYSVDKNTASERFPEGIVKVIPYSGKGEKTVRKLFTGVKQGMHGLGHKNFKELARDGILFPARRAASKGTL
ncbi:MAG: IMP dehydrogenase [bacterium]|nr:IMP dehydrogenase [bacterium]